MTWKNMMKRSEEGVGGRKEEEEEEDEGSSRFKEKILFYDPNFVLTSGTSK